MKRFPEQPVKPDSSARHLVTDAAAPAEPLRKASTDERNGRAARFAAAVCVIGMLAILIGQTGWWTLLLGPAYLASAGVATMLARGRARALLAVVAATASMAIIVAILKLTGLA